jgi:hypothetical protein
MQIVPDEHPQAIPDDPEGSWHDDLVVLNDYRCAVWESLNDLGVEIQIDMVEILAAALWWRLNRDGGMGR